MLGLDLERTDGFSVVCADGVGHEPDFRGWSPRGTFGSAWAEEWGVTVRGLGWALRLALRWRNWPRPGRICRRQGWGAGGVVKRGWWNQQAVQRALRSGAGVQQFSNGSGCCSPGYALSGNRLGFGAAPLCGGSVALMRDHGTWQCNTMGLREGPWQR